MVFWGFVINYMFCINLFVTIVDMIRTEPENDLQENQSLKANSSFVVNNTTTTIEPEVSKQRISIF